MGKEIPKKVIKSGNTTIIIHSPLVVMSDEEQKAWFKRELENKNPALMELNRVCHEIWKEVALREREAASPSNHTETPK